MIRVRCKKHKTYTAKRAPRKGCLACWALYKIACGNVHQAACLITGNALGETLEAC